MVLLHSYALAPVAVCRILFSLLFALIAAGLLSIFWHSKIVNIAISGIGAAVFACYIVFDVQLMMGGGAYSIEPDEYVFAAINIYLVSQGAATKVCGLDAILDFMMQG